MSLEQFKEDLKDLVDELEFGEIFKRIKNSNFKYDKGSLNTFITNYLDNGNNSDFRTKLKAFIDIIKDEFQTSNSQCDNNVKSKILDLLKRPHEWSKDFRNQRCNHKKYPDYHIKLSEPKKVDSNSEPFAYFYTNPYVYLFEATLMYNSTELFTLKYFTVDEMRLYIGNPSIKGFNNKYYLYYNLSSEDGIFHYFLTNGMIEVKDSRLLGMPTCQFLFFNNDTEHQNFYAFLNNNQDKLLNIDYDFEIIEITKKLSNDCIRETLSQINKIHKLYLEWRNQYPALG